MACHSACPLPASPCLCCRLSLCLPPLPASWPVLLLCLPLCLPADLCCCSACLSASFLACAACASLLACCDCCCSARTFCPLCPLSPAYVAAKPATSYLLPVSGGPSVQGCCLPACTTACVGGAQRPGLLPAPHAHACTLPFFSLQHFRWWGRWGGYPYQGYHAGQAGLGQLQCV